MYRTFYKIQLLAVVLFFLSVQLTYSQQDGVIQDERSSIDYTNSLQQSADQPSQISTYDETIAYSMGHALINSDALMLPFYQGFEADTTIPAGWTQEVVSGPLWRVVHSNHADAGTNNLVFRSFDPNANGLVTRLVTPPLDMTGTDTAVLKFSFYNDGYFNFFFYQDVLRIKYKSALTDEWTTLATFNSDVEEWTEVSLVLPNLSDSYYIAFEGESHAGFGIGIDEVMVNEGVKITTGTEGGGVIYPEGEVYVPIGSSPKFKVRAFDHSRISALLVDGEPIAEAVDQTVYYYKFPPVNTEHTIMASFIYSESYTVSAVAVPSEAGTVQIEGDLWYNQIVRLYPFESTTRYYFSHWTSNGDSISAANPLLFVLKSDTSFQAIYKLVDPALTMPVYEGFETNATLPDGWTQELINGPLWTVGNGNAPYPPQAYVGNNNLVFRSDNPNANGIFTRLVTPQIDMTGINIAVLKFYYVNAEYFNTVAHQDQLTLKYKASYYDSWTTLATFNSNVTDWTEVSIVLPNPSPTYFIAFEGKSNAGYGISIDELTINEQQMQGFFITAGTVGNGSINPSGQVFVSAGETQQFNIEADYGYHIYKLLVDGGAVAGAVGESQFTFTFPSVNAAHTIMAYFTANELSVTVDVVPSEAGSVGIQGELYYGNTIKLWPMSTGDQYVFSHWTSNGVTIGTEIPFVFVLLSDTLIQAHFTDNSNGGALTLPFYEGFEASNNIPDGWTQEVVDGPLWKISNGNPLYVPLQAYAGNHNLLFQREVPYSSGLVTRLVTPELDVTGVNTAVLKFYYANPGYSNFFVYQDVLTIKYKVALEDEWTTLETFSSDVTDWTEVSIVLPNLSDSYYIAFEGECNSGLGITIDEVTINEPQMQSFVITAGAEGNGSISPSGEVIVPAGETQQFDVNANHGNQIASLLVDDVAIAVAVGESQFTYSFESVNAAHTIMASFMPDVLTVKVDVFPRDAGSVSIQGERSYGETIKLFARSSSSKYVFSHWEVSGKTIATENPFKFELLSDTLFEAHFRRAHGIGSKKTIDNDDRWSDQVKVYPNPVKDNLYIDLPADALVLVFDMQGRLQYEASLTSGTSTINLSGLNQGTYILKLQFEDQVITKRILRN
jgi:hypothetical protein